MKLICCATCSEVFSLSTEYKECDGGHCGGQYINRIDAKIWGDPSKTFVLGFSNPSLIGAIRDQLTHGDKTDDHMYYMGKHTPSGREFTAFIIPDAADSVIRVTDKFEPIEPAILSQTSGPTKN